MIPPFAGRSNYQSDREEEGFRLIVAIPCHFGTLRKRAWALLDIGAEWSVLSQSLVSALGDEIDLLGIPVTLSTRLGTMTGELGRVTITFPAAEGESLSLDATAFVCGLWPGPTVIGWRGCLGRMKLGLDPSDESFYFAPL